MQRNPASLPALPTYKVTDVKSGLRALYRLLSKRERWMQGFLRRRNAAGRVCQVCVVGAAAHLAGGFDKPIYQTITQALRDAIPARHSSLRLFAVYSVIDYNDAPKRKHSEILNWIRRAARQQGVTLPKLG